MRYGPPAEKEDDDGPIDGTGRSIEDSFEDLFAS